MYLTAKKLEEIRTFFFGSKRIGDQYILPLEFSRVVYMDPLNKRKIVEMPIALIDYFIGRMIGIVFDLIKFIFNELRTIYWHVFFKTEERRFHSEVIFFDWEGRIYDDIDLYRNRHSLINVKFEVSEDQIKTNIVKI